MAGKGDSPRPVDGDTYRANYERIFAVAGSSDRAGGTCRPWVGTVARKDAERNVERFLQHQRGYGAS